MTMLSECLSVFYSYWIKDLIGYIKEEEPVEVAGVKVQENGDIGRGLRLVAVFVGCQLFA